MLKLPDIQDVPEKQKANCLSSLCFAGQQPADGGRSMQAYQMFGLKGLVIIPSFLRPNMMCKA